MKFIDREGEEPGTTQTLYHKLETDLQITLSEMEKQLALIGYELVIKSANEKVLEIEVWITK